jgi:exodeoxyribonuclease VIII
MPSPETEGPEAEAPPIQPWDAPIGLHQNVPEEAYHASSAVSSSRLKAFLEAPAKSQVPGSDTASLRFGSLIHTAILTPDLLEGLYCVTDLERINKRDKAYKAEQERAGERELVKKTDWEEALRIRDAVHAQSTCRDMLAPVGLLTELSFAWDDPVTGLRCRGRADGWRADWCSVIDLKSTADASPDGFARSVANYHYHLQCSHYCAGLAQVAHEPQAFFFLAVEKEPPYLVGIYELDLEARQIGDDLRRRALDGWAECARTGVWPGYDPMPVSLSLPGWAVAKAA